MSGGGLGFHGRYSWGVFWVGFTLGELEKDVISVILFCKRCRAFLSGFDLSTHSAPKHYTACNTTHFESLYLCKHERLGGANDD